jgi:hypothetical protein
MSRTGFENLRVYNLAEEMADLIWEIVIKWGHLSQNTVGKQLINAADSIGANIAEGARGSLFEVKHWLRRAYKRKLLTVNETDSLQKLIEELTPKLSAYILSIGKTGRKE